MKPFEICRPGTFVDATGQTVTITEQDLRDMAMGYNTKLRKAPLVFGHPAIDDPAYGWVASLDYRDGALVATVDQVAPEFEETVKSGAYPNRSAAFFPARSPDNPTPGKPYLKHVGFLGARQPAVDGLKPVEFGAFDGGDDMVVSLAGWEGYIRHQERQRIEREHVIANVGDKVEALIKKAILRPGERDGFLALAQSVAASSQVVAFGIGEEAERVDGLDLLMRLMEARPPLVTLGTWDRDPPQAETIDLAMPAGMSVDSSRADLHNRATSYAGRHNVPYHKAVRAVARNGGQ